MMKINDLLKLVEDLSFDEITSKSDLIRYLNYRDSELRKMLEAELSLDSNQEWIQAVEKKKIPFVIFNDRWKKQNLSLQNSIRLTYLGINRIPVISVDIHQ